MKTALNKPIDLLMLGLAPATAGLGWVGGMVGGEFKMEGKMVGSKHWVLNDSFNSRLT